MNTHLEFQPQCAQTVCRRAAPGEAAPVPLRARVCQTTSLFFVPLVAGFSTASYLKVHIKTHHGSPLPPSSTMHTYPEPRGELQTHNGNPYHMGRQCSVEGKQPRPRHSQLSCVWLVDLLRCFVFCFFWRHLLLHPVVCLTHQHISPFAAKSCSLLFASVRCLSQLTGCVHFG